MTKKRYVVDTNIIISRLLLPNSIPAQAVRAILDNGILLFSDSTLQELSSVLERSKFDKYISLEARKLFIDGLQTFSMHLEIKRIVRICRDPKDNKILEVAINGKANLIITGDQDLLVLQKIEEIPIITPQEFMNYA